MLAHGIQDRSPNHTRFVVVGARGPRADRRRQDVVAFAFADEDRPGQLVAALQEFSSARDQPLEDRVAAEQGALGTYIFLVDLAGHRTDAPLAEALERVEKECSFFRVLGSYPRYRARVA